MCCHATIGMPIKVTTPEPAAREAEHPVDLGRVGDQKGETSPGGASNGDA
jgi:hypothetical protein